MQRVGNGKAFQLPANLSNFGGAAGPPFPKPVLRQMESFFGASFADVRVYVDRQAPSIGALAFTHGSNVYFAPGQYNPHTPHGQQLLGHELTHVVQQRAGRVRNPYGSGVAVVQDRAMEAEADRMGQRAASSAMLQRKTTPPSPVEMAALGGSIQPKALGVVQRNGPLTALAEPKVGQLPNNQIQQEIADWLDSTYSVNPTTGPFSLGKVVLPGDLGDIDISATTPRADLLLEDLADPAVRKKPELPGAMPMKLRQKVVDMVWSTMKEAGQLQYLSQRRFFRGEKDKRYKEDAKILAEVHYYPNRGKGEIGFHKDTRGQTLFVNLNYVNSKPLLGPEYIVNPAKVAEHQEKIKALLPQTFLDDLSEARQELPRRHTIKYSTVPAYGYVGFVDELIHHTTPFEGRRKLTPRQVRQGLLEIRIDLDKTPTLARLKGRLKELEDEREQRIKGRKNRYGGDREKLAQAEVSEEFQALELDYAALQSLGCTPDQARRIIDWALPGYTGVNLPTVEKRLNPIRRRPLKRAMSVADQDTLPFNREPVRRFFRTWVRVARK